MSRNRTKIFNQSEIKRLGKQCGIGLLELMLSLAIIALLLLMATRYYGTTQRTQVINQASTDIAFMGANYKQATAEYGAGVTLAQMDDAKMLPDGFTKNTAPAWDGCAVTMALDAGKFTFTGFSKTICAALKAKFAISTFMKDTDSVCETDVACSTSNKLVLTVGS